MKAYVYGDDLWCEPCAKRIGKLVTGRNEYPDGPHDRGGGEADSPNHCAGGADCLMAMALTDGRKVGVFLGNPLTSEGTEYVRRTHRDNPTELTSFWMDYYGLNRE